MPKQIISVLLVDTDGAESKWIRRTFSPVHTGRNLAGGEWKFHRASTIDAAGIALGRQQFDIILIGLRSSGSETKLRLKRLREIAPQIPIIGVTDIEDEHILNIACTLIAASSTQQRRLAISAVILPGRPHPNGHDIHKLTPRERQIFQLIAEGRSTKQVAEHLDIAVKTAETHRTNLMRKLEIRSVSQLVRYAIRHGIVEA